MDVAPSQLAALRRDRRPRHLRGRRPSPARDAVGGQPADPRAGVARSARSSCSGTTPCRPTAAGEVLLRLARQTAAAARRGARRARRTDTLGTVDLPVAVNADSLATWFRRRARGGRRLAGRRAAAARRGPGVLGGTAAQRRRAGRGDLGAERRSRAARSSSSAPCATCRPRPRASPSGGVAGRGPRLGGDADGGLQREGRAPARRAARAGCRRAAGGPPGADLGRLPRGGPSRPGLGDGPRAAAAPDVRAGRLVPLGSPGCTSTSRCTGSAGASTHPCWTASPTSYAVPPGEPAPPSLTRPLCTWKSADPALKGRVSAVSACRRARSGQKADSSRSMTSRSTDSASARSAAIFGSTFCAKNCAAATLPS